MADLVVVDVGDAAAPAAGGNDTTAQAILDQALSYLYTGVRLERDKLAGSVTANTATLATEYQRNGIKAGGKLSIDLEDYHVWAVSDAGVITVQPGDYGSTAADHTDGAIVYVNAEWTPFEVFREMNNELKSLSSPTNGLYNVATVTLTYNPARVGYDLTDVDDVERILAVYAETPTGYDRVPVTDWRIQRNLDATDFPSGFGLFTTGGYPGRDVIVAYAAPFSPLTALANNVAATTGLPYSAHDILAMGAAIRCAAPSEIDRNQTSSQGSGRRSGEVPAGARLNAIRGLAQMRRERINEEAARLARDYPVRLIRRF